MTIQEMHNALDLELDKTGSLSYPSFLDTEKDYWLTSAQLKFVKDTLAGNRNNPTTVKNSLFNIEDLGVLLEDYGDEDLSFYLGNIGFISLPSDYLHFDSAIVINNGNARFPAKLINSEDKYKYLESPVNQPWLETPLVYVDGPNLFVIIDKQADDFDNVTEQLVNLKYYKIPTDLSLSGNNSSELPSHTHSTIVKLAADMMLENIESPRFPNNNQLINESL